MPMPSPQNVEKAVYMEVKVTYISMTKTIYFDFPILEMKG